MPAWPHPATGGGPAAARQVASRRRGSDSTRYVEGCQCSCSSSVSDASCVPIKPTIKPTFSPACVRRTSPRPRPCAPARGRARGGVPAPARRLELVRASSGAVGRHGPKRNWHAHSTLNREEEGSSPSGPTASRSLAERDVTGDVYPAIAPAHAGLHASSLRDRPAAGHGSLTPAAQVRILFPEPRPHASRVSPSLSDNLAPTRSRRARSRAARGETSTFQRSRMVRHPPVKRAP